MDVIRQLGEGALATRLKRLSDRLMQDVSRVYREHAMPFRARWFSVLFSLREQSPQAISELASSLGLTHTAINQIAAEMSLEGLLVSRRDQHDERRRLLSLSAEGEAAVTALEPIWKQIWDATSEVLAASGRDLLGAVAAVEQVLDERSMYDRIADRLGPDIVHYQPQYAGSFRDLNLDWLERYFTVEDHDRATLDDPEGTVLEGGGVILFAIYLGHVVGTCALLRHDQTTWELAKMAVARPYQSRGTGRKLANAALEHARGQGACTVFLLTSPKLEAAGHLYRSLGFQEIESPPVKHTSYDRCSITMQLELDGPEV